MQWIETKKRISSINDINAAADHGCVRTSGSFINDSYGKITVREIEVKHSNSILMMAK